MPGRCDRLVTIAPRPPFLKRIVATAVSSTSTVRVIEVGPVAADFVDVAHQPLQEIELMRRLIDQDAAALGGPFAAPGIGLIVGGIAPAIHREHAEGGPADLACVDGSLHAQHRFVQPPLTDHAEFDPGTAGRGKHGVAIGETGSQRLFDQHVRAGLRRLDRRLGVQRMRRANHDGFG